MNGEFTEATKKILAKRAGEKCSVCSISTSKPSQGNTREFINLGEAGHICGNRRGKHTRYVESMTDEERSDISNAIWLCRPCHKEIDSDSIKYTVEYLIALKDLHENKVYIGAFDIQWKEKDLLEGKVIDLQRLIAEQERNITISDSLHNHEITQLRIQLEKVKLEKEKFESSIVRMTNIIAGFNFKDITNDTSLIVEAFKAGDFERTKELLRDETLVEDEAVLARKRLLRANLREVDRDYLNALSDYQRAFELSSTIEFLENYVGFLRRYGKIEQAISLCIKNQDNFSDPDSTIWISGAIGELYAGAGHSKSAIPFFDHASQVIDEVFHLNPGRYKLKKAKIVTALGIAHRNTGDLDLALADFELALNLFWEMSTREGITHVEELGNLFNGVGLLYMQNNKPKEALLYYNKAEKAFEEIDNEFNLSVVYLNKVDALIHYKVLDVNEATKYLKQAKEILTRKFTERPLINFELYVGVLTKSADNLLMTGHSNEAEAEYLNAINITEDFRDRHGIASTETLAILYSNYAVFLTTQNRENDAIVFNDKAIDLLLRFNDSEHSKHFNLTKSFLFKSELISSKEVKRELLKKADYHVSRCSDKTIAKALKIVVDKKLKELESMI